MKRQKGKAKSTNDCEKQEQPPAFHVSSPIIMGGRDCQCRPPDNRTHTPTKGKDDKPLVNVTGAESVTCSMDTMDGIVNTPMLGAPVSPEDDALSLRIMGNTTPTSSTRGNAPTTGIIMACSYAGTTLGEVTIEEKDLATRPGQSAAMAGATDR